VQLDAGSFGRLATPRTHHDADSVWGGGDCTQYSGMSRDQAYGKLRRGLVERGATVTVEEPGRYLQARIPHGTCL
jgi:hypothetical protein